MFSAKGRHRPRKRFGQHFLTNPAIADRIVASAELDGSETVLEIGPGTGMLTERLLEAAGNVYAVEIDRDLAALLTAQFEANSGFHLIVGDFLKVDLAREIAGDETEISVVSNIPYNISAPIVEKLINAGPVVKQAVLMVQKEVAERLMATPGGKDYGLLSINVALHATVAKIIDVKPGSFNPPPDVMSTVIRLDFSCRDRYSLKDKKLFRQMTGAAFRQRRKMVRNTLVSFMAGCGIDSRHAYDLLGMAGIEPTVRPERIDVGSFVVLANAIVDAKVRGADS